MKKERVEWIELPNQESIRTLRERESHKFFEVDTIKQVDLRIFEKSILEEGESLSKPIFAVISSKA